MTRERNAAGPSIDEELQTIDPARYRSVIAQIHAKRAIRRLAAGNRADAIKQLELARKSEEYAR